MRTLKIASIVGARPNFMKLAPFAREIEAYNVSKNHSVILAHTLIHTGQHYDESMSKSFFHALNIPEPDINLGIGSGTHAEQVGRTMIAFEPLLDEIQPDWVVVMGDVNATCACGLTAKKGGVRLAHVEAGLRSFDRSMPEEINRVITDQLADLLLTPDSIADDNLRAEGITDGKIQCVGNIMIDTLDANRSAAESISLDELVARNHIDQELCSEFTENFAVLTLHRPSNVDDIATLTNLVRCFVDSVSVEIPLIWPLHPRTRNNLTSFGLLQQLLDCPRLVMLQPLEYHEMLRLNLGARVMFTDSGGLQEECCVLGTPCLTLRENTERPVTLAEHGGVCELVGNDPSRIRECFLAIKDKGRREHRPPLWDGSTAKRVVEALIKASNV
jgi:UDP-N-acetylglucosamine 2-epimerase (non-hydrolysing)